MGFTFAVFTSDPNLLACELERLQGQVGLPGEGRFNAAGVGSYAQDQVLLRRFPSGALPRSLAELLPAAQSEALLYHAQSLPLGASVEESTQPFRFRNWLFCQAGEIRAYAQLKRRLMSELPGFLQTQIHGDGGAAEGAFALFLKNLRELGALDSRRMDPARVAQVLLETARAVQELSSQAGASRTSDFSLIATNQDLLVAARFGAEPLQYTLLEGSERCALCGTPPGYAVPAPKLRAHMQRRTVAVASHVERNGWMEIPAGQALTVDSGAGIQIVQ